MTCPSAFICTDVYSFTVTLTTFLGLFYPHLKICIGFFFFFSSLPCSSKIHFVSPRIFRLCILTHESKSNSGNRAKVSEMAEEHSGTTEMDRFPKVKEEDGKHGSHEENGSHEVHHKAPLRASKKGSRKRRITVEDIQIARETAELFKSNIFKLEVDELIKELKLKDSHCKLMERVLHRLHDVIQQVPESKEMTLEEATGYFAQNKQMKVSVPYPDPKPTALNYKFQYRTPQDISLVGSFGIKAGIQQPAPNGMVIDVALTMPKELFQKKDYMNFRALYKRAFYIAYLVEQIVPLTKKAGLPLNFAYEYANGDVLCPTVRLEPVKRDSKSTNKGKQEDTLYFDHTGFSIRLYVAFPDDVFDAKKLLPDRNCIRIKADGISIEDLPPTPLYNSSILTSCSYSCYLKYLYTSKKMAEAFRDACVLGNLWLKQRGFGSNMNSGGFGHFEFATLMAALLEGGGEHGSKVLLHGFSSYQLFKATIRYLATQDLCDDGYLSFFSIVGERSSVYKTGGFGVPTIFDKNTKINILWKMSASSYGLLRHYADVTSRLLNDVVEDRFQQTFIMKANSPVLQYDALVQIPLAVLGKEQECFGSLEKISFITFDKYVCAKISRILEVALRGRAAYINVRVRRPVLDTWSLGHRRPYSEVSNSTKSIEIGLVLDPAESEKRITKGPLHSQKTEGEKFAAFWGSKAQVRRYKDGNIQYSCLWPSSTKESPTITVLRYILDLHLVHSGDLSDNIVVNNSRFNSLLPRPLTPAINNSHPLIMPSHFQELRASFDSLCKIIYRLEDLPLAVKSILPASPALRGTSTLVPVPFAVTNPDFFNECILQFESSTRWPDELYALERTKTAFLLKISSFVDRHKGYKCVFSHENIIPYMAKDVMTRLNVLTPEGYGFSIRVLTERDEVLYLRIIENADARQKKAATDAYLAFMRHFMGRVKHHRAMSSLVTRFPFFGPTVRLFKSWLDSQLLLVHFPDELVELIAIQSFIDPASFSDEPSSVGAGFLRILNFIAHWNWREDPLILDLSKSLEDDGQSDGIDAKFKETQVAGRKTGALSPQEHRVMYENFTKLRKDDPNGSHVQMFVSSREDPSGKLWSTNSTGIPIISRLTALSKAVMGLISQSTHLDDNLIKLIFTPALKDFDFVIEVRSPFDLRVKSGVLPRHTFKNLIHPLQDFSSVSEWCDPLQEYYEELRARFSNVAVLTSHRFTCLSDEEKGTGNVIAGVFNPAVTRGKKKFRVNIGFDIKPTEDEHVECNKESILGQMVRLGGDLVVSVHQYH